jgi:Domain of unknown function (DUF4276)
MSRLLVHVEGETEESFVNEHLAVHLYTLGYESVSARLVGNSRLRGKRGGIKPWASVSKDITRHLTTDKKCVATTMVDYYALPKSGAKAWPGRELAIQVPHAQKAQVVQSAIHASICEQMGEGFQPWRFIPFVIMHEFEALLFSDCTRFAEAIGRPELASDFQLIRDQFANPEMINDSPETAPSKRVEALMNNYQKPLYGSLAVGAIGLSAIRDACPNFSEWILTLEKLVNTQQ